LSGFELSVVGFLEKKFNKNVFVLGIVSLLTDISSEMIFSILPVFMSSVLMLDKTLIGLIEGIAEATANVSKIFAAKIEKIFKKKKTVILWGYSFSAIVKPLFAIATNWWQILLFRFGDRIGKGIRGPPRDAMIADSTSRENRGYWFGFHRMMDRLGAIIGPIIAFVMLSFFDQKFNIVFLASFIPAIIAVLIILFFVKEETETTEKKDEFAKKTENQVYDNQTYKWFFISSCVFALGNMSFAFLLIRIQEIGLPIALVPIAYLLYNISYSAFSIPFGKMADKIGRKKTLSLAGGIFAASFAILAFSKDLNIAILILALYGIGIAGIETTQRIIASEIVPKEKRTGAIGTYQGITGLLLLPASLIAGFLWSSFGANIAFAFSAITSVAAVFLLQKIKQ